MKRKRVYARDSRNHEERQHALVKLEEHNGPASILWMLFSALIGASLWAGILFAVFHFLF